MRSLSLSIKLCAFGLVAWSVTAGGVAAKDQAAAPFTLKDGVILLIRHAEKPDSGHGLTPEGEARAKAYVEYFKNFTVEGAPLKLDYLACAADSKQSHRPRLTLEPLSKALELPIDARFENKHFQDLVAQLAANSRAKHILICWHHGEMPELLQALGGDPDQLLPKSKWPAQTFDWVLQLRYGPDGHLLEAKRLEQHLMPGDSAGAHDH